MTNTAIIDTKPWWRNRSLQLATLVLLVCFASALRVMALDGVVRRTPDERVYTAAAQVLLEQGSAGMPVLAARVAADNRTAANPVRSGYLFLLADTMRLTGRTDEGVGAELACAASIVSVVLLAVLAWRRFSPTVALTAVLLYSVNPAALMTSRRCWEEAITEAVALLLIFVASEIVAGSQHIAWAIVFAATGAFAITVKQTAALSFVLCALGLLAALVLRRQWRYALWSGALCLAAALGAVVWLSYLVGGWQSFTALLANNTNSLDGNLYSVMYESGSLRLLLQGLATVSATTLVLALVAVGSLFGRARPLTLQRQLELALAGFCLVYAVLMWILPHHINLRYFAPAFAPLALLAGVGMAFLLQMVELEWPARSSVFVAIAAMLLIFAAMFDDARFRNSFATPDVQDLSIKMVLAAAEPPASPADVPTAPPNASFEVWIASAVQASQAGDCQRTIDASTHAVQLKPDSAVAWNDLAAGFECSHQWPSAVAAARHALELQPDFQLARNNLNWSLEQQSKETTK